MNSATAECFAPGIRRQARAAIPPKAIAARFVAEQGWQPDQLIRRIWELSQTFLVAPTPQKASRKKIG